MEGSGKDDQNRISNRRHKSRMSVVLRGKKIVLSIPVVKKKKEKTDKKGEEINEIKKRVEVDSTCTTKLDKQKR
jgi:hypothetical protein